MNYNDYEFLVIIPARGGSKGIPKKNLRKIAGKSLVGHAISFAQKLEINKTIFVSTDCNEITDEAIRYGEKPPFKRPEEISQDLSTDSELIEHAVIECEKFYNKKFDFVLMFQPTSPVREARDILRCLDAVINKYDSAWTVSKVDLSLNPLKQLKVNGKKLHYYDEEKGHQVGARQVLEQTYLRNGVCYAWKASELKKHNFNILLPNTCPIEVTSPCVDIDNKTDLKRAEALL